MLHPPLRVGFVLAPLLACFVAAAGAAAGQDCPECLIEFDPLSGASLSSAAHRDTAVSTGDATGSVRYDLVVGSIESVTSTGPTAGFQGHVIAHDRYELVGPAGGPMMFHARLHVTGTIQSLTDGFSSGTGAIWAALEEFGGGPRDSVRLDAALAQTKTLDHMLQIDLVHAPGESFELACGANSGCDFSYGLIDGQLAFDLPPGYAVASRQGYAGSGSVPVRTASWGALKLRYH
jgi:hypothetical protein